VLYVGSSNFAGWHIAQANEAAAQRHLLGLVCEQSLYNLSERTVELEVLPACRAYGLGFVPWSPLGGGLLAGAFGKAATGRRAHECVQMSIARHRSALRRYEALCEELGHSPAEVALAWLMRRPGVTAPVIGPRTSQHLQEAVRAAELELDEVALKSLDAIWPGPGLEAPEAHAW